MTAAAVAVAAAACRRLGPSSGWFATPGVRRAAGWVRKVSRVSGAAAAVQGFGFACLVGWLVAWLAVGLMRVGLLSMAAWLPGLSS